MQNPQKGRGRQPHISIDLLVSEAMTQNLQRSLDSGQRRTSMMNNKKICSIEFESASLVVLAMPRSLSGTLWEAVKTGLVGSTLRTQFKGSEINSI